MTQHNDKEKEAFKDLEKNPVWYNEEKKIPIKTIRCFTGLSAVEPVKKDEQGNDIGFVKPGNNHHIAIYIDEQGKKQEHVCSFWHAVERKKYGISVIIEDAKKVWDKVLESKEDYSDSFLSKLPKDNWIFEQSLQQNEMFILGLANEDINNAIDEGNKLLLSNHLYRVQKLASMDYWFRHHLETELTKDVSSKIAKRFYYLSSIGSLYSLNPTKIKINNIGEISKIGQ